MWKFDGATGAFLGLFVATLDNGGMTRPDGLVFGPAGNLFVSSIVYSGAAQFVAVDLVKVGTPLSLLVFTIATVGLRHVLMSASISRHVQHFPKLKSSILMFWLTDEAWAILERRALLVMLLKPDDSFLRKKG